MKRIILLLIVSIITLSSLAQTFYPRTNGTITPTDKYLGVPGAFYLPKVCDTLSNPLHGGKDSVGAIIVDTCNHKLWIRDFASGTKYWKSVGTYIVANGLNQSGDSILMGGPLTKTTFLRTSLNRSDPNALSQKFLFISNVPGDSSAYANYFINSIYDRPGLIVNRQYGNDDTLYKQYGGAIQGATKMVFDASNTRYKSPSTPFTMTYGGANMLSQLFPSDTSNMLISIFGNTGSAYSGDIGIGGPNKYNLTLASVQTGYPFPVYRGGVDYARSVINVKREMRGSPSGSFVSDWKSQQENINAGTTEYGSYINKNFGFMAYGTINPQLTSPSKAKTLAVSTVDTSYGFLCNDMKTALNEVKNGYGFVNLGTLDYNFFAGNTKFGGTMPSTANVQTRQVVIDSTLQVGRPLPFSTNSYLSGYWERRGLTSANFATTPNRGAWFTVDNVFTSNATSISNSGATALRTEYYLYADSVQDVNSSNSGVGLMGATLGLYLRKGIGYLDTTTWKGGSTAANAASALQSRFDCADGTAASGRPNLGTGYFSAFNPTFQFNSFNTLDHAIWLNVGIGQFQGTTNATNGYGVYIQGFPSQVTNKYAIYQAGTLDTVFTNGKLRFNNLTAPPSTYNLIVHGTDSVAYQIPLSADIIPGTTTNSSAVAGNIGERVVSTLSTYTNYSTTATYQNVASITLTPGNWDVSAFFTYSSNGATIVAADNAVFLIGTATASSTGSTEGINVSYVAQAALVGTSKFSDNITPFEVKLNSTTTYYLNTQASFTLGNPQYVGTIRAIRTR